MSYHITLPEANSSPLKINNWKTIRLPFGESLFSGAVAVSFREGNTVDGRNPAPPGMYETL